MSSGTVADPRIDRRVGGFLQEFIHTSAGTAILLYALERSGGLLSLKILKSKVSNDTF